ncbi:MAG: hypothetical protein JF615_05015 [Asticcacaulis sp.]|nr:hypothetical protein [Asticcacaulis sp.]
MRARLGLEHGAAIDRPELEADVQAANTYPFRQVHVTLRNGKAADARDVDLDVTAKRPWEVYAGIKYATITPGPLRRYYFGGSAGSLLGRDSVLTWLWTGSQDAVLRANSHPKLRDLIVTYSLPVTRRGQVEAAFNDTILGFTYLGTQYLIRDVSGSMGYRWVLRRRPAGVEADLRVGVEAKHERTLTLSGVPSDMGAEAYQLFAGYHRAGEASDRSSDFDLALRISPGNVDQGNSNSHQLLYSGRPGSYAHYAYASLTYDHAMRLGQQWAWHAQVIAQAANGAVPYSEQPPVGGMGLVRGYTIFDGSFDSVAIVRNELGQAPSVGGLRPRAYAFFDYGVGRDISAQTTAGMASWGLGGKITVAPKTTLTVEGVETLRNGPQTRSGVRVLNLHLVHRL